MIHNHGVKTWTEVLEVTVHDGEDYVHDGPVVDLIKAYGFIHCGLHDDLNDLAPGESLVLDTPEGSWTITPSRTRTRHEEIIDPWAYDEARLRKA